MEPNPKGGLDSMKSGNQIKNDQIQVEQCVIEIDNDENEKVSAGKTELLIRYSFARICLSGQGSVRRNCNIP